MLRIHISTEMNLNSIINPLNTKLNPICHLLGLLGAHHILHVSRIRVKKNKCGSISSSCTPKIQSCFIVGFIEISYADAHAGVSLSFVLMTQTCPFVCKSSHSFTQ
jgi:hypothetical protein